MNKKGVIGMFIVFVMFAILLIFLFGFGIPILIEMNSNFYTAGKDVLTTINTSEFPQETQDAINGAVDSIPEQINILSFSLKYSWFAVLFVLLIVIYMWSRTLVETELK